MVNINITSGELFYDKIVQFIRGYVKSPSVQDVIIKPSLAEFVLVWQAYKLMTKWIWYLFMHLETSVIKLNDLPTLAAVALVEFKLNVYDKYHQHLTTLALRAIEREREGEHIDRSLLQETLQVKTPISVIFSANRRVYHDKICLFSCRFLFYFSMHTPFAHIGVLVLSSNNITIPLR